uniref:Transmembrane protein 144 n=1 Tax=Steinernema glaseri TaxID=37863 RepID=A0A1I8AC50_9BILA
MCLIQTMVDVQIADSPLLKPVREERKSAAVTVRVRSAFRTRASGIAMALFCGIFYASTNLPVFYIQDNMEMFKDAVPEGIPYMFSLYSGVFLGSSITFLAHCIITGCSPVIDGRLILPAISGGILWGFAMAARFVANDCLSQTVTFPITTTVPGCTAAAWSLFYFKEIKGSRNHKILTFAFLLVLLGAIMVTVSKLKL